MTQLSLHKAIQSPHISYYAESQLSQDEIILLITDEQGLLAMIYSK